MPSRSHIPVYAHRLGGDYGPEASRPALKKSLSRKVEGLECDVIVSADDEIFALHDPDLGICTNLSGWAEDHEADEIAAGRIRGQTGEVSDEPPLRLRQLLELIPPELPLQLDVKAYADYELVDRTTERACLIVKEHGTADRIEIISFFSSGCQVARSHGIATRLVAWADYAPDALVRWVVDRDVSGLSYEGFILFRDLADTLHGAGLTFSVGAVNSRGQVERLLPFEPDIIVSDRPAEIRDILSELSARDD
jgi:glycerophosphoryl diester phosphodiesterase